MPDKDFIDDLLEEEGGEQDTEEQQQNSEIDTKIDQALTAKEKGFYNEMRSERQKRQEIQSQLDRLTGTINAVLESRKQSIADASAPAKKFSGIPVAETEDGDLYIPEEHLVSLVKPYEEKIRNLETHLQRTNVARNAADEAEKVKAAMVGENELFGPAYQKYQAARKWANDRVVEFQKDNGIAGTMSSGQALDLVFDSQTEKEFNQQFPGIPLDEVVTAEDSQRNFKKMLNTISKTAATRTDTTGKDRFRKVLNKPSGLGSTPNAKAGHVNVSERLSTFSADDIMSLGDKEVDALLRALRSEELEEGYTFK